METYVETEVIEMLFLLFFFLVNLLQVIILYSTVVAVPKIAFRIT